MRRRRAEALWIVLIGLALVAGGCGGADRSDPDLTVFGTWRDSDADAFRRVLDVFEEQSGLVVHYTGTTSFITSIGERAQEGDRPDVAMFPQPGLLQDLRDEGYVVPLRPDVQALVEGNLFPTVADIGQEGRPLDGVPYRFSVKSLVWYRPDVFAERGYAVPATFAELEALSARITDDGLTPWCLGIAAFDATGWPATDWVEDIVLRRSGTETYDAWVAGTIPFTSDRIGEAISIFGDLVLTDSASSGSSTSRRTIINTTPAQAMEPMFADTPGCVMYRQASFQKENLPPDTTIGPDGDVDVFVLPPQRAREDAPLLVGGEVAAALTDRAETWELLSFLATPEAAAAWAEEGGFISPYAGFPLDDYGDPFDRRMAELLRGASVVRFDGSDRMYAAVGTNSFFTAMTLYVATNRLELAQTTAQAGYDR